MFILNKAVIIVQSVVLLSSLLTTAPKLRLYSEADKILKLNPDLLATKQEKYNSVVEILDTADWSRFVEEPYKFETGGKGNSSEKAYQGTNLNACRPFSEMHGNFKEQKDMEVYSNEISEGSGNKLMMSSHAEEVKVRQRPQIPPKPQIDVIRYSMANVQESGDCELDILLNELSALQSQLDSSASDQLLLGLPTLPVSDNKTSNSHSALRANIPLSTSTQTTCYDSSKRAVSSSLSDEFMRPIASSSICPSPDHDSAFGDSSSTESRNRCRNSAISSSDSCRGSLNTPSPTQQVSPNQTSSANLNNYQQPKTASEIKALKIKEALEKMREADIKKVYVKFFLDDGSSTVSMLIDERWTVAEVIRQIAEKQRIQLTQNHSIVEEYPDLLIRRIYEDHEYLVENILVWTQNSKNRLYFTRRPDKYAFIDRPEEFLLTERNIDLITSGQPASAETKKLIVKEFFETDNVQPPELEGWLLLKADGKKSWKKHFFVLRSSGLYYCSKGRSRNSKDLQCLMNMQTNQVYTCTDWRKKYKAPTNLGFAIKHPKIQVKASKYIKYVCAEDPLSYHKWMAALRIAKNGRKLFDSYEEIQRRLHSNANYPVKVDIPQVTTSCHPLTNTETQKVSLQDTVSLLNITRDAKSPSLSRMSSVSTTSDRLTSAQNSIIFDECDDAMTGTIKKAPCDIMSQSRRQSSQTEIRSSLGTNSPSLRSTTELGIDSDSDEEQFPPPPPTIASDVYCNAFNESEEPYIHLHTNKIERPLSSNAFCVVSSSLSPAKLVCNNGTVFEAASNQEAPASQYVGMLKKMPPPPPPKRAETTRLRTTAAEALHNELEIAMARRLKQIEQH